MAWAVYSAEDFPKWDEENKCQTDYKQALGVQVILRAHQWTNLDEFGYKHTRYESWVDGAGEGKEHFVSSKEVAVRLAGDFGSVGIGVADLDRISDQERQTIEKRCEEMNMKHRKRFVDRFEQQFRVKTQGGPGRWVPNTYEQECYDLHGIVPPEVVQRANQQPANPVQVIETKIDPELLATLVAAEVAKITAPPKR